MLKRIIIGVLVAAGLALLAGAASGQEATPPPLDELGTAWKNEVVLSAQTENLALEQVKATDVYKQYAAIQKARIDLQADRTKKIEARFPGFTIDWAKGALVAKKK